MPRERAHAKFIAAGNSNIVRSCERCSAACVHVRVTRISGKVLFIHAIQYQKRYVPISAFLSFFPQQFHADWWAAKIQRRQGSSSVAMTEAAHWVNTDQPDDVNRRLDEFFAGVK